MSNSQGNHLYTGEVLCVFHQKNNNKRAKNYKRALYKIPNLSGTRVYI